MFQMHFILIDFDLTLVAEGINKKLKEIGCVLLLKI